MFMLHRFSLDLAASGLGVQPRNQVKAQTISSHLQSYFHVSSAMKFPRKMFDLLSIMLHLDPTSCTAVNALRRKHGFPGYRDMHHLPLIYHLIESPKNQAILHGLLSEAASAQLPFDIDHANLFHCSSKQLPSIGVNLEAQNLMSIRQELLRGIPHSIHRPQMGWGPNEIISYRPNLKIKNRIPKRQMQQDLDAINLYCKDGLGTLKACGFILGDIRDYGHTPPEKSLLNWKYFPFKGQGS